MNAKLNLPSKRKPPRSRAFHRFVRCVDLVEQAARVGVFGLLSMGLLSSCAGTDTSGFNLLGQNAISAIFLAGGILSAVIGSAMGIKLIMAIAGGQSYAVSGAVMSCLAIAAGVILMFVGPSIANGITTSLATIKQPIPQPKPSFVISGTVPTGGQ